MFDTLFDLSQFRSVENFDVNNYEPLSVFEIWTPTPYHKNLEVVGYGGLGIYLPNLYLLWPSIVFAIVFHFLRLGFKKFTVPKGLKLTPKESEKFMYQAWLLCFYTLSSLYGLHVMYGKPWASFPLGPSEKAHQLIGHPQVSTQSDYTLYYSYQIGFFLAELIAIFVEARRSDFREYLIHHTVTLYLLIFSFMGFEHVPGGYVVLIHDLSDIFLCASKMVHYCRIESATNICFGVFIASFAFFRLYCLPSFSINLLTLLPKVQYATINFWIMIAFLQILQGLQFFWFGLIIRMVYRLATGVHGDVRSDDDEAEGGAEKKKGGKPVGAGARAKKSNEESSAQKITRKSAKEE